MSGLSTPKFPNESVICTASFDQDIIALFNKRFRDQYPLGALVRNRMGPASCDGTELDRLDRPARYPPTLHRMSAALGPSPTATMPAH